MLGMCGRLEYWRSLFSVPRWEFYLEWSLCHVCGAALTAQLTLLSAACYFSCSLEPVPLRGQGSSGGIATRHDASRAASG